MQDAQQEKTELECPACGSKQVLTRLEKKPAHWCRRCGAEWDDQESPQ